MDQGRHIVLCRTKPSCCRAREGGLGEQEPLETAAALLRWVTQLGKHRDGKNCGSFARPAPGHLVQISLSSLPSLISKHFSCSFMPTGSTEELINANRHATPTQLCQPGPSLLSPRVREEKLSGEQQENDRILPSEGSWVQVQQHCNHPALLGTNPPWDPPKTAESCSHKPSGTATHSKAVRPLTAAQLLLSA